MISEHVDHFFLQILAFGTPQTQHRIKPSIARGDPDLAEVGPALFLRGLRLSLAAGGRIQRPLGCFCVEALWDVAGTSTQPIPTRCTHEYIYIVT